MSATTNDTSDPAARLQELIQKREEILRGGEIHSQLHQIKELVQKEEACVLEIERQRVDAIMKEYEEQHPLITEECPLCLEDINMASNRSLVRFSCCGKGCCRDCNLKASIHKVKKCPMCRADIPTERKAIKQIKALAKKGVAFAQAEEGWKFLYGGNGYPLDVKQAVKFLELASEQKNPKAMRFLGHTLYEGKLVTRDVQRGLYLTHEAADLGNVESRLYLGKLYVLGNGHTRDIPKAIHNYTIAYRYKHDNRAQGGAAHHLGMYHFNIDGQYGKEFKALMYYGEAVSVLMQKQYKEQDSYYCYSSMILSKHYLSIAAKKGLKQACFPLALVLMDLHHVQYHGIDAPGHSVISESMHLALKAANDGEPEAKRWISSKQTSLSSFCAHCKISSGRESAKLQLCSRCKSAWYCGKDCQITHWKEDISLTLSEATR
eukprot:scaffold12409_cov123-Skeletonema_marinoi.AAC.2